MPGNALEVMGLSKRYTLGESRYAYETLRESLAGMLRRIGRGRGRGRQEEEIWPLRDVSFDVPEGQALGIIGRNGAGKSTLLKILSRITEPTTGVIRLRGRVGSLLEVGTGFHPELTGRENLFLNGALIGMSRKEIRRRFDEIVSFADISRFLDTPVKRYSSGMYLRLAFAIAAHLEPEILVVDEILAVGDTEFQRRCLQRLSSISLEGRTVLFVSHDLDAIQRLCSRVLWLETGRIREDGPTDEVVERYLAHGLAAAVERSFADDQSRPAAIHAVIVRDSRFGSSGVLRRGDPLEVTVRFQVRHPLPGLDLSLLLFNARGARLLDEAWSDHRTTESLPPGTYVAKAVIPPMLNTGDYTIGVWLGTAYETIQYINEAAIFRLEGPTRGRTERLLQLGIPWSVEPIADAIDQTSLRKLP